MGEKSEDKKKKAAAKASKEKKALKKAQKKALKEAATSGEKKPKCVTKKSKDSKKDKTAAKKKCSVSKGSTSKIDKKGTEPPPVAEHLSREEEQMLHWIDDGLTNAEISKKLNISKWDVQLRINQVRDKLHALELSKEVSGAIAEGAVLPMKKWSRAEVGHEVLRVGIVGCGRGGSSMIDLFKDDPSVDIVWVADRNINAKGVALAKENGIPVIGFVDEKACGEVEVVVNVTGSPDTSESLIDIVPPETELMGGTSARLLWRLVDERRQRLSDKERVFKEREIFYHLGLLMEKIDNKQDAGYAIVDYATRLTGAPVGSLALFDELTEDMVVLAAKGFDVEFKQNGRWRVDDCSLSKRILSTNHTDPVYVEDLGLEKNPNAHFLKHGIRTVMAVPLVSENRITGILFVKDFQKRQFSEEDESIFSLLSVYAALTLEKVKSIENMRRLSITDGLTGLFNQRYLMEQMQKEMQRAVRHDHNLSLLMIDIDHFKSYNDTYGHLEGNKLLKTLAKLLTLQTRNTDTVGRFGGEEFCFLIYEVNKANAIIFANRLISEIANYPMPNRQITVSVGIASLYTDGLTHLELMEKADARLYKAKNEGRNRVCY